MSSLPLAVFGENEELARFFFFSLSNKDSNSSSKLLDSSSLEGAETVRLGEDIEFIFVEGRGLGKGLGGKGSDGKRFSSSLLSASSFLLAFNRGFGFE